MSFYVSTAYIEKTIFHLEKQTSGVGVTKAFLGDSEFFSSNFFILTLGVKSWNIKNLQFDFFLF